MNLIAYLPDVLFVVVTLAVGTWMARQNLIETIACFFALLLSGIAAIAFHGPLAAWSEPTWFHFQDFVRMRYMWIVWFLIVYGFVTVGLLAIVFRAIAGSTVLDDRYEKIGRRVFGFLGGYVLASTLLVAVHTFPGNRDFWGAFPPERALRAGPIMRIAPDYQLLTVADFLCNPGHPITGTPWLGKGPFVTNNILDGDYGSFPLRYCVWREFVHRPYSRY